LVEQAYRLPPCSLVRGCRASGTWNQSYAYDAAWRLQNTDIARRTFGYGYSSANPASALFRTLSLPNGASISNHYDSLARLDYTALLKLLGAIRWTATITDTTSAACVPTLRASLA